MKVPPKAKTYNKIFNQPITKKDVRLAVLVTLQTGNPDTFNLSRKMGVGYHKAQKLSKLLYDAGVVVDSTFRGTVVLLKGEPQALNAAYRQLRKVQGNGNRTAKN